MNITYHCIPLYFRCLTVPKKIKYICISFARLNEEQQQKTDTKYDNCDMMEGFNLVSFPFNDSLFLVTIHLIMLPFKKIFS